MICAALRREWTTYQGCWTIYNGGGTGADDVFRQYNAIRCFRLAGRAFLPMTVCGLHSEQHCERPIVQCNTCCTAHAASQLDASESFQMQHMQHHT